MWHRWRAACPQRPSAKTSNRRPSRTCGACRSRSRTITLVETRAPASRQLHSPQQISVLPTTLTAHTLHDDGQKNRVRGHIKCEQSEGGEGGVCATARHERGGEESEWGSMMARWTTEHPRTGHSVTSKELSHCRSTLASTCVLCGGVPLWKRPRVGILSAKNLARTHLRKCDLAGVKCLSLEGLSSNILGSTGGGSHNHGGVPTSAGEQERLLNSAAHINARVTSPESTYVQTVLQTCEHGIREVQESRHTR